MSGQGCGEARIHVTQNLGFQTDGSRPPRARLVEGQDLGTRTGLVLCSGGAAVSASHVSHTNMWSRLVTRGMKDTTYKGGQQVREDFLEEVALVLRLGISEF